jgi:hypothetical protein
VNNAKPLVQRPWFPYHPNESKNQLQSFDPATAHFLWPYVLLYSFFITPNVDTKLHRDKKYPATNFCFTTVVSHAKCLAHLPLTIAHNLQHGSFLGKSKSL